MGAVVKLLAICERNIGSDGAEAVSVRVHPAMIPRTHPLAAVREAYNAVFVEAEAAGELMFYGRGAGGQPTASAVLGDLVSVARNRVSGRCGPGESAYARLPVRRMGEVSTRYHISLDVADRPGVLAQVAAVFAAHDVSIETVRQQQRSGRDELADPVPEVIEDGSRAALVVVTHTATDAALAATVETLAELPIVAAVESVMRVEGE
jgi:homoserine dehydrogenase